jgi:hypothetical protein
MVRLSLGEEVEWVEVELAEETVKNRNWTKMLYFAEGEWSRTV